MPGLEVPKFITDLATGLQNIAAQLDDALAAIQAKRNDFNTRVLTQLRNYHFDFTDTLADKLDDGVKNGKIRVTQAIAMVDEKGVFAALEDLKKLKIEGEALNENKIQAAVADHADTSVGIAYNRVLVAVNEIGKDKAKDEKTKRKSAIATAIIAFKNAFVKYVAINKYGLNPDDVTDDMDVDALDAKNAEKRTEAINAAGLYPEMANALSINTDSAEFKNAKITDLPGLIDAKFKSVIDEITAALNGDFRLGNYLKFLKKPSIADLPDGVVTRDLIEANKGKDSEDTIGKLVNNVYRPKIQEEADTFIENKLMECRDLCEPDRALPDGLRGGGLLDACNDRIIADITGKADDLKGRVWNDVDSVAGDLEAVSAFSESLKKAEEGLAAAFDIFSTKVADLAAEDKKLSEKIIGLIETKMKNIDSEAAVTKTLDEIKKVLQKSTGVDFGVPDGGGA